MLSLINGPGFSLLHASINQKTHKLVIRPRLYLRQLANVAKALFGLRPILIPNISGHLLNQFFFFFPRNLLYDETHPTTYVNPIHTY